MKFKFKYRYTVRGRGHFPSDMLRYDHSFPYSGEDVAWMHLRNQEREVMLVAITDNPKWDPTRDRWRSFGWIVTEVYGRERADQDDADSMSAVKAHPDTFYQWDVE